MEIRRVVMTEYIDQAAALARAHWQETESEVSAEGPALMVDAYRALENADLVIAFAAFDGDQLVGYCVTIVAPHLHYGFLYAHHDLLYLAPGYRRGMLALRLMREAEKAAEARGARWITWHAKPGSALAMILERRTDYALEECIFRKEF